MSSKAIALVSGGLDSTLATKLVKDLGIELICLNTVSPFCLCSHHSSSGCFHGVSNVAKNLGLKLVSVNVSQEILEIIKKPKHGFGSNVNPCIDCRILLFKKAKELMQSEGAQFVVTGEVLEQRPMSQKRKTMQLIEKESGLEGLVLRPLSAQVLEETIPEKEGLVDREKLLAISGRGRKEQFSLAFSWGIKDYPCPSGGCLLTDPGFSRRVKDLLLYNQLNLANVLLLKAGRHFRLNPAAKLVVGRDEKENNQLVNLAQEGDYLFYPDEATAGPTALGRGDFNEELINFSCRLNAHYFDLNGSFSTNIIYKKFSDKENSLNIAPLSEAELVKMRI